MIIAIDESGDFRKNSSSFHFFSGISIRQQSDLYNKKKNQFFEWEQGLSRKLKNHKGEIKSSVLSENDLSTFVENVLLEHPTLTASSLLRKEAAKTGGNRSESCLNLFFNLRINILCS